jgi:hypothetical protein
MNGPLTVGGTSAGIGVNITGNNAFNSFQTIGGINVGLGGASSGTYAINNAVVINSNGTFVGAGTNTTGVLVSSGGLLLNGTASAIIGGDAAITGTLQTSKHLNSTGSAPTMPGCSLTGATDVKGMINCPLGVSTLTFSAPYVHNPICLVGSTSQSALINVLNTTTTTMVINMSVAGVNSFYHCLGD